MTTRIARAVALVAGLAVSIGVASCGTKKSTEIVVAVSSETPIPDGVDRLEIEVLGGGDEPRLWNVYPLPGGAPLPGTLGVYAAKQTDPSEPVQVSVYAYHGKSRRFVRRARLPFVPEKSKLLRVPIRLSCFDFPELCPDGTTCIGGECHPSDVDPSTLPDFDPALVFGKKGQSACFDPEACLASLVDVTAEALATSDCHFAIPTPGRINVGMAWAASPTRVPVLDPDAIEGFTTSSDGKTATLAPGLCKALRAKRATAVFVSSACATKSADTPVCEDEIGASAPDGGISTGEGGVEPDAGNDAEGGTAIDAGACAISLPGASCDPIAQTGCPTGQACRVTGTSSAGFSLACVSDPFSSTATSGASCTKAGDCTASMVCYQGRCEPYCCADEQCCAGGTCPAACSVVQTDGTGHAFRLCKTGG